MQRRRRPKELLQFSQKPLRTQHEPLTSAEAAEAATATEAVRQAKENMGTQECLDERDSILFFQLGTLPDLDAATDGAEVGRGDTGTGDSVGWADEDPSPSPGQSRQSPLLLYNAPSPHKGVHFFSRVGGGECLRN